jgi:hypothetical protein
MKKRKQARWADIFVAMPFTRQLAINNGGLAKEEILCERQYDIVLSGFWRRCFH